MTATDITGVIAATLAELGDSADAVADQMRSRGIKGVHFNKGDCPLARLLLTLPGIEQVEVGPYTAIVYPAGVDGTVKVDLPEAATAFINYFDAGIYLDLVDMQAVA